MELIANIDKNAAQEHKKEEEEAEVAEQQVAAEPSHQTDSEDSEKINEEDKKTSFMDSTKKQIIKVLQPMLDQSGIIKNIRKKKYLEIVNSDQNLTRRSLSVSTIELSLFQSFIFRQTSKLNIRLSYDHHMYQRDIFQKKNEFRI